MIERLIDGGCPILLNPDQKFARHGMITSPLKKLVTKKLPGAAMTCYQGLTRVPSEVNVFWDSLFIWTRPFVNQSFLIPKFSGLLKQLSKHVTRERKEIGRYCFLFSQHIIICTPGRRLRLSKVCLRILRSYFAMFPISSLLTPRFLKIENSDSYLLSAIIILFQHGIIPLKETTLIDYIEPSSLLPEEVKQLSFTLSVRAVQGGDPYTVTLKAATTHEKDLWTNDISQVCTSCSYSQATAGDSQRWLFRYFRCQSRF